MGKRGPKPEPNVLQLRKGNTAHKSRAELDGGLMLPPATLAEPRWVELFPAVRGAQRDANRRMRARAAAAWRQVVPLLDAQGVVAAVDLEALVDYCRSVARLDEAERILSRAGLTVTGRDGGQHRHPLTIVSSQLAARVARLRASFGLTPSDRTGIPGAGASSGGDSEVGAVFDWGAPRGSS